MMMLAQSESMSYHNALELSYDENDDRQDFDLQLQETALTAYEEAIELAPREPTLYYHKGQVLAHMGRVAEAEAAYETARRLGYKV